MFFKTIENGFIISVGENIVGERITKTEYNNILKALNSKPKPSKGFVYKLNENLEWVEIAAPPLPDEITDSEALEIILGGVEL